MIAVLPLLVSGGRTTSTVVLPHSVRVAVQQAELDRARATLALIVRQRADLVVRAGLNGVLQLVPVDVGQQVASGANVARVADPSRLKAEVRINETEAQDIQIGQNASIDTRNGICRGRVTNRGASTPGLRATVGGDVPQPGYHSRNSSSRRVSSTAHRTCNNRWAPSADHRIGWRLPIRALTRWFMPDSARAVEIRRPWRRVCA